MSLYDNAGRIHKRAFLVSNFVLFIICICSVCARYYIRLCIQKQFSTDDGILLFGVACLIVASGLLVKLIDKMYVVEASESGNLADIGFPRDYIRQAYDFYKLVTVAPMLTWCTISSVKFSYLFLFRKLVLTMPRMTTFWWFAVGYNCLVSIYGVTIHSAVCPHYYSLKALQCVFGKGLRRSIAMSMSQMVLDIVGDLFIIFIPCRLIWSVKLPWTKKLALASTLCLAIITIFCTIVRIGGIRTGQSIQSLAWTTYWQFIAANIAVTMTAGTAFRAFFTLRSDDDHHQAQDAHDNASTVAWFGNSRKFLFSIFSTRLWQSWRKKTNLQDLGESRKDRDDSPFKLKQQIPRAMMTGMRTFIDRQAISSSQDMRSARDEEYHDDRPFSAVD